MPIRTVRCAVAALMASGFLFAAQAQSLFERLVTPGEVIEGHAKLEKDCARCHKPFEKGIQNQLCLDCHKDVAKDLSDKAGFHGKRTDVSGIECKHCHTDHKGRKAEIAPFDHATFNHGLTDFRLEGAHATAACEGCHRPGKKFRAAEHDCIGCHRKDEPHKGALGERCERCHSAEGWKKTAPFDHGKTRFPLAGKHKDVACVVCHVGEKYKSLPHACVDCHAIQDVHTGRYGAKCEKCHAPEKWKAISFDHGKDTKYPLIGKHREVKCDGCHFGDLFAVKLGTACVSCHKANDPHQGRQGARCETCHAPLGWRQNVAFDHDLTRFPLVGLHTTVPCEECHRTPVYNDTPTKCADCHKDEHHSGRLGTDCQRCHNPNGFAFWTFDHSRETKFPLTGAHVGLDCHACHTHPAAAQLSVPSTCYGCHSGDDAHRGAFGRSCEACHSTKSFTERRPPP